MHYHSKQNIIALSYKCRDGNKLIVVSQEEAKKTHDSGWIITKDDEIVQRQCKSLFVLLTPLLNNEIHVLMQAA